MRRATEAGAVALIHIAGSDRAWVRKKGGGRELQHRRFFTFYGVEKKHSHEGIKKVCYSQDYQVKITVKKSGNKKCDGVITLLGHLIAGPCTVRTH